MFLIPSYLSYEPRSTHEVVGAKLALLAIVSAGGVGFALWRGFRSSFATRSLSREWLTSATSINVDRVRITAYRIRHPFPIIAVVGTFKPRLFIAERVLQTLSKDELAAAIEHECGHIAARDNFKRSLLRVCRDVLMIVPCGRSTDRAWAEAAESAADEYAAQYSPAVALNLASALVRIAKMIPEGSCAALPLAAFLVGDETRGVKARVRRLIEIASMDYGRSAPNGPRAPISPWIYSACFVLFAVTIASTPHILPTVHSVVEHVVSLLS
jgi:beta-lactamase regulating signal transducer with metallopeptidase domain